LRCWSRFGVGDLVAEGPPVAGETGFEGRELLAEESEGSGVPGASGRSRVTVMAVGGVADVAREVAQDGSVLVRVEEVGV